MTKLNIANKDGFRWAEQAYLIGNEYGLLCISYARNEQEALDNAADEGYMDSELMCQKDCEEYESNGWHDSFKYAGNAGKPVWCEHLWIKPAADRK